MYSPPFHNPEPYCFIAGDQRWTLHPVGDEETGIINDLASIMALPRCTQGREVFITIQDSPDQSFLFPPLHLPIIISLPMRGEDELKIMPVALCAQSLALHMLPYGGFLIHGALIEKDGKGIILAGSSGSGKTTASQRMPFPWHSLSDDAVLVVEDRDREYIAYPWPTWRQFYSGNTGKTWDTQKSVPLAGVFFLQKSSEDLIKPVNLSQSLMRVMDSIPQMTMLQRGYLMQPSDLQEIYDLELKAAECFVQVVPIYILNISLSGNFWEHIDGVLHNPAGTGMHTESEKNVTLNQNDISDFYSSSFSSMFGDGHIPIVYSGPSMNPTLKAPDLLDVVPYSCRKPAIGDVICFNSPEDKKTVVHRIIHQTCTGARTQGDNNQAPDEYLVPDDHIIGQVIGAMRGRTYRKIYSGRAGRFIRQMMHARKNFLFRGYLIVCHANPVFKIVRSLLPQNTPFLKTRVVLYTSRDMYTLKIFVGSWVIGEYNTGRGFWKISFPFRYVIQVDDLPNVGPPPWK